MRAKVLGLVILVTLVSVVPAAAQPAGIVASGSRVRLEASSIFPARLTAIVVAFDESSLKLRTDLGQLVVVPRHTISKLDVSVARQSNTKAGLLIGAAVGLVGGLSIDSSCTGSIACIDLDRRAVAAVGSVVFAGVGALIGSLTRKETWAPVVSSPRLSVVPTRKGGVVSLSFPF
jgi:hypothetical protein